MCQHLLQTVEKGVVIDHLDQEEVDRHRAAGHATRRMWCPSCAQASIEEDDHARTGPDHKDTGLPMVCLDFKELAKNLPPHVVMRLRGTGSTYGVKCARKGPEDRWVVQRLASNIESWGIGE